ncbi:pyrroloquinoline quinone biosynthesis protein PqqB [Elioraea rosea]|uniref:pyrroloquinoline quinone biosynthesis protein PqqB n=1 Tax=Elioraea rosea TaxID=2492390 RepID=UPI0011821A11|nr:pyrroloquinoline quinone biosynthesis protein PqqB [Elioraea rosea]
MHVRVLGSAAGGGFPQWNCACRLCRGVREGTVKASPRTQESTAVSADGERWVLLNTSPEIRSQIEAFPALHPKAPRHTPIGAIVLTNGDLDHVLGLLSLRESQPLVVYAAPCVRRGFIEGNSLARTLSRFPGQVTWHDIADGTDIPLADPEGAPLGLTLRAAPAPGRPPPHLKGHVEDDPLESIGIALTETETGRRMAYVPGTAAITPALRGLMDGADAVFLDGTCWSDDELIAQKLGTATATSMGHVPVGGGGGSLASLAGLEAGRRVLIHLNNTNPLLDEESAERREAERAGWTVAHDGMEIVL